MLLSHDHYDHLCRASIEELARRRVPIVTSLGVGAHLEAYGVDPRDIVELDWWEEHVLPGGALSFRATPAQHFSGRTPDHAQHHALVVVGDHVGAAEAVLLGRHRAHRRVRAPSAQKLGPFDVTMLEIGAWHPAWGEIHLGPKNALKAFQMLGGGTLLPVHWGTFDLALHEWDEPAETLLDHGADHRRARADADPRPPVRAGARRAAQRLVARGAAAPAHLCRRHRGSRGPV